MTIVVLPEKAALLLIGTVFVFSNFSLPEDMVFGFPQILSIITYSILFIIGVSLNATSLYKLMEERIFNRRRTRMTLLLIHLSVADLMVVKLAQHNFPDLLFQVILFQIPLEISWNITVSWMADDITCRIMMFLRILGFYLSGFIMMVISLDRLSAILFPLSHISNTRLTKRMLLIAWLAAPLCSLPQSFVFQLKTHPLRPEYAQCTTLGNFGSFTLVSMLDYLLW